MVSTRWLPDGESWVGTTSTFYTANQTELGIYIGEREDRRYACFSKDAGCFIVKFTFSEPELSVNLGFSVETDSEYILTNFAGYKQTELYYYCLEDGQLVRTPTPAPTISALPTGGPTSTPSS